MISSEVQRTLVKSPPELWAELSDADALARHLGVLGNIRITRSEPEKLVEWEADGASGRVQIKPSGWGTKVTLSVTRDVEASPPMEAGAGPDPAPPAAKVDEAATAEPEAESGETPTAEAAEPSGDENREAHADAQPDAESEQTPLAATSEPIEPDELEMAEPDEPEMAEPEALAMAELDEPATDTDWDGGKTIAFDALPEPQPAADSRRGFFARLFGRVRAWNEADAQPLSEEMTHDYEPARSEPAPSEQGAAEEPPVEDTAADARQGLPGTAIESLQARFAPTEEPFQAAAPVSAEPATPIAEPEPVAEDPAGPLAEQAAEEAPDPVAEQAAEEAPEPPGEPPGDLAAELRAAEEVAAEEVTAMLTAVLDRLGAAHHRPFSRS
jgi:hypothetical protein